MIGPIFSSIQSKTVPRLALLNLLKSYTLFVNGTPSPTKQKVLYTLDGLSRARILRANFRLGLYSLGLAFASLKNLLNKSSLSWAQPLLNK
jgi:hypothetical protein